MWLCLTLPFKEPTVVGCSCHESRCNEAQVRCHGRVVYPAVCLVYSSVGLLCCHLFMPGGLWLYMVYPLQRAATVMGPATHTIEMVFFRMLRALLADVAGSTKSRKHVFESTDDEQG